MRILSLFVAVFLCAKCLYAQDFPSKERDIKLWYKSYELKKICDSKKYDHCAEMMDVFMRSNFVNRRSILLYGAECYQETKQFHKMRKLIVEAIKIKHRSVCKIKWSDESKDSIPRIDSYCDSLLLFQKKHSKYSSQEFRDSMVLYLIEDQGQLLDPKTRKRIVSAGYESFFNKSRHNKINASKLNDIHIRELEKLIVKYGFPTKKIIGNDFVKNAVWLIIVHSNNIELMEKYLLELKKNFGPRSYAIAIDKILVEKDLPQRYGTQAIFSYVENQNVFYPIEDYPNVDIRRMNLGLSPLYIYAKDVGVQNIKKALSLILE